MASSVFEGSSVANMFVKDCWVNGIRRLLISHRPEPGPRAGGSTAGSPRGSAGEEDFYEIRTEWSDRNILYLHRSSSDLRRLFGRLVDSFPEDTELTQCPLLEGLVKIKEASDIEMKLNEVERLLKNAINMPRKYSRSEVMLTFFERSPLDQLLRNDKVHRIQTWTQSPVQISEIMRSNGFCLANTETVVFDDNLTTLDKLRPPSADSAENTYEEDGMDFLPAQEEEETEAYVTNLSYYHLVPFETDILE